MELPQEAGLRRRLAYGENIRSEYRQRQINRRRTRLIYTSEPFIVHAPRFTNYPYIRNFDDFETYTALQSVEIGVTLKNMLQFSKLKVADQSAYCVVCQESCKIGSDIMREVNCGHVFHAHCIDTWFCTSKKCPLCKFELE